MKFIAQWMGAIVLVLLTPTFAAAQVAVLPQVKNAAGANVPSQASLLVDVTGNALGATNPMPTYQGPLPGATSTPLLGSITPATATPTSGAATITAGVATIGPLVPQLGRDVRVVLKGTWSGSLAVGTSVDGCATVNPLTVGGIAWGVFTGNANEVVDHPTLAGVSYCATATVTSGTLAYAVRQ